MPQPVRFPLEEFRLPIEPEILEGRALALAQIGIDHPLRLPDQEGVRETVEILVADRPRPLPDPAVLTASILSPEVPHA